MLDQNYITQDQYDEALADDVYSRIQAAQEKNSSTENTVYTYFEDELTDQIINDLMNIKGYTKKQATNLLYSGGLKVYTTQDSKIQNILDEEYADPSNYPDTLCKNFTSVGEYACLIFVYISLSIFRGIKQKIEIGILILKIKLQHFLPIIRTLSSMNLTMP